MDCFWLPLLISDFYLWVKLHEENNFILYWVEKIVFGDQLVNVFVLQFQVDLQSFVVSLVICAPIVKDSLNIFMEIASNSL